MSQEAILEKVRSIVSEQLSVEAGEVKPDSNFQNDLGADSLDTVELVMALEEAFDIEIPDEAAEGIATVGDAVKYIEEKQSGGSNDGETPSSCYYMSWRHCSNWQRPRKLPPRASIGAKWGRSNNTL